MDGKSIEIIHNTSLVWPNAITIDYESQTIYWMDAKLDKLESSFVNGSNRRVLSTAFIFHPFSIAFYDGVLYWSEWVLKQVIYAPISSPASVVGLVPALPTEPMVIKVVAPDAQPISE